jgi:hypothetical protein
MKIRNGLVSNSSSSSFWIAAKELSEEKLLEAFDVPETSPLRPLAEEMASFFFQEVTARWNGEAKQPYTTIADLCGEDYCCEEDELLDEFVALIHNGFKIWYGSASDDGEGIEEAICKMTLEIRTPDLILVKDKTR